jgi:eukaryotic-like serine/threonine-protein kinase
MEELVFRLRRASSRRPRALAAGAALAIMALTVTSWQLGGMAGPDAASCEEAGAAVVEIWPAAARDEIWQAAAAGGGRGVDTADRLTEALDGYAADWSRERREACVARVRGEQSDVVTDRRLACLDRRLRQLEAAIVVLRERDIPLERREDVLNGLVPIAEC